MVRHPLDLAKIRSAVRDGNFDLRQHARQRARERGVTTELIKEVILQGEILEQIPQDRPYPKCLLMAFVEKNKPLYVSLAYNEAKGFVYIITVHWFDPQKWLDPWTRR